MNGCGGVLCRRAVLCINFINLSKKIKSIYAHITQLGDESTRLGIQGKLQKNKDF